MHREIEYDIRPKKGTKDYIISRRWRTMVARCYDDEGDPTDGRKLCPEWHKASGFMDWITSDGNEERALAGMFIDRYMLEGGNTEYHPDKCVLVPKVFRRFAEFTVKPAIKGARTEYGLTVSTRCQYTRKQISLGTFQSRAEMLAAWKENKINQLNEFRDDGLIDKTAKPIQVYDGIMKSILAYS